MAGKAANDSARVLSDEAQVKRQEKRMSILDEATPTTMLGANSSSVAHAEERVSGSELVRLVAWIVTATVSHIPYQGPRSGHRLRDALAEPLARLPVGVVRWVGPALRDYARTLRLAPGRPLRGYLSFSVPPQRPQWPPEVLAAVVEALADALVADILEDSGPTGASPGRNHRTKIVDIGSELRDHRQQGAAPTKRAIAPRAQARARKRTTS